MQLKTLPFVKDTSSMLVVMDGCWCVHWTRKLITHILHSVPSIWFCNLVALHAEVKVLCFCFQFDFYIINSTPHIASSCVLMLIFFYTCILNETNITIGCVCMMATNVRFSVADVLRCCVYNTSTSTSTSSYSFFVNIFFFRTYCSLLLRSRFVFTVKQFCFVPFLENVQWMALSTQVRCALIPDNVKSNQIHLLSDDGVCCDDETDCCFTLRCVHTHTAHTIHTMKWSRCYITHTSTQVFYSIYSVVLFCFVSFLPRIRISTLRLSHNLLLCWPTNKWIASETGI